MEDGRNALTLRLLGGFELIPASGVPSPSPAGSRKPCWPIWAPAVQEPARAATREDVERRHILDVLEGTGWRVRGEGGAAHQLGVKPTTLESRMKKLGIERKR
jgi:transcriptional regulator with GAF, ATPase, and Fis domain